MANIKVNNELVVKGKVSITRKRTEENEIIIYGSFMTHIYYEEIKTLETERYLITGIDVYEEMYGSDDYNIIYNFKAKDIKILGTVIKEYGISTIVDPEEMDRIEDIMYKNDHSILGDIGEEYKDKEGENNE